MPFFSRNIEPEEETVPTHHEPDQAEMKRGGIFGSRRRDPSPASTTATAKTAQTGHTHNRRHSDLSSVNSNGNGSISSRTGSHRSFLHRSFGQGNDNDLDPSIVTARERVLSAETAERVADRALENARREVREARDLVKRLEIEAKEEARKAKIKQNYAREVSRRAKPLGRHDL
ncbi:hypothetical protein SEPCBS57363_006156 [Sporothrix epigloea]|uniref:Uncharacterized protein n=1 Tax=Sporothrix epigloea TaxID=1892477 RepID=A0ABP0E424_9PEZI